MGVQDSLGSEPQRPTPELHEMTNADQNTRSVFRAPPGWPPVPPGWIPPAGWTPDPTWPPAPPDWRFWEPADVKPTQPPSARERSATMRKKTLLGGLILLTVLAVLGAIGMVGVRSDTINPKNAAIATAQHEQAVANYRLAVANVRLTTAQQTAARARADEAAAAAGQTITADMNPMVKPGLAAAWHNTTTKNQSSVCAALRTNPNDVAQAAANGVPSQDKGIVTVKQVLEFYQNACLHIPTP